MFFSFYTRSFTTSSSHCCCVFSVELSCVWLRLNNANNDCVSYASKMTFLLLEMFVLLSEQFHHRRWQFGEIEFFREESPGVWAGKRVGGRLGGLWFIQPMSLRSTLTKHKIGFFLFCMFFSKTDLWYSNLITKRWRNWRKTPDDAGKRSHSSAAEVIRRKMSESHFSFVFALSDVINHISFSFRQLCYRDPAPPLTRPIQRIMTWFDRNQINSLQKHIQGELFQREMKRKLKWRIAL